MATPDWLASTERVVGASHPLYSNTKDRCNQTIDAMIQVGHTQNGLHLARNTGLSGEIGTFSGNGAARTISLSNSGLTPKKVYAWESPGTELVTNGEFTSDTTGWTASNPGNMTLSSVAGGVNGNCLKVTGDTVTGQIRAYQNISGLTIDAWYYISGYAKNGDAGGNMVFWVQETDGSNQQFVSSGVSPSSWTQYSLIFQATATTEQICLGWTTTVNGQYFYYDVVTMATAGSNITALDNMTSEKAQHGRYQSDAWEANLLDNLQAGSFDIGYDRINTNGITNYYLVLGVDTDTVPVGDAGAGSAPDWITSSILNRIIADNTATVSADNIANDVESQIWTQFIEEHTVAGAHSITLQHVRIETISWAGNDADNRTISCAITDLDILDIEVYVDGSPVASKTSDMSGDVTKDEDAAAFAADMIQDITTNGEIEIGTLINASGSTYIACLIGI